MPDHVSDLQELARELGVDSGYWDWQGHHHEVGEGTLRAVITAFGRDAADPAAALAALRQERAQRVLPPCVVVRAGVEVPVDAWGTIVTEAGHHVPIGGVVPSNLTTGYHRIVVERDGQWHEAPLIVTPPWVPWPAALDRPVWGLATQLYSARSRGSWEVGDLHDLATLATWSAREHGADYVLVNPLHAAEVVAPIEPSPYLPTSRRYGNAIYLRVEDVPEYATLSPAARAEVDRLGAEVRAHPSERIDRDAAWTAKAAALRVIHAAGLTPSRSAAFAAYRGAEGEALARFATWCALTEEHGPDWREWPQALRDPVTATAPPERVEFHAWLQWQLREQLGATQAAARAAGMRLGVVADLAVGVSPIGADSWSYQDVLANGLTVGAPADAYAQTGQNWNQPPWRPDRLAELGYRPLAELFRNTLRDCGGLRVDHVIGLFRLWWIPSGMSAMDGTYVHYDHEALIGILALEAERAGAVLVGEDLGNVEPWVRTYLAERGVLGTPILWFESDLEHGGPLPPERWRPGCLASVTTHDLPPSLGYLAGDHVRLRDRLGLLTRSVDEELAAARDEQAGWIGELERLGLLAPGAGPDEIVLALHRFLTLTPSRLRCVALTDAVGERRTQNQPGTDQPQYPNWRIPLGGPDGTAMPLEEVVTSERVAAVLRQLS